MLQLALRLTLRGARDLRINPWAQILTLAAVTLVSFLVGLFLLFLHNLDRELQRTRGDVLFQVYWKPGVDQNKIRNQWSSLATLERLTEIKTFTPDEALEGLADSLGHDVDLSWVKSQSPLPATALLAFEPPDKEDEDWRRKVRTNLETLPDVEKVQSNAIGAELAEAWGKSARRFLWPLTLFLALMLALVVGNTIKLALLSRRDEIDILRLVGAQDWYIRLPLLVTGAVHGLGGALLSLVLLKITQAGIRDLLNVPPLYMEITFLPFFQVLELLAILTAVAVLSSWAAARNPERGPVLRLLGGLASETRRLLAERARKGRGTRR